MVNAGGDGVVAPPEHGVAAAGAGGVHRGGSAHRGGVLIIAGVRLLRLVRHDLAAGQLGAQRRNLVLGDAGALEAHELQRGKTVERAEVRHGVAVEHETLQHREAFEPGETRNAGVGGEGDLLAVALVGPAAERHRPEQVGARDRAAGEGLLQRRDAVRGKLRVLLHGELLELCEPGEGVELLIREPGVL